jgi:hypothetical protein
MAVPTSDLACGDLGFEALEAYSIACQPGDRAALLADVVEVQDDEIDESTIHTPCGQQHILDVPEVTNLVRQELSVACQLVGVRAPPSSPLGRAPPVAVDADHVAAGDLQPEGRERHSLVGETADVTSFLTQVIELQHDWVALSAIDAAALPQDLKHKRSCFLSTTQLSFSTLPSVEIAAVLEILPKALTAPPLVAVP